MLPCSWPGCSSSLEQPVASAPIPHNFQSCITVAHKIKTLNISPENTELPENAKIIDIYQVSEYLNNKTLSLEIHGRNLIYKAKVQNSHDKYPIEFHLITENKLQCIILASQGNRKWIFKWKA